MKQLTFILFLISGIINSQNLVPNPSFELFSNCPNSDEQIDRATYWNRPPNVTGTPDYYNSCNTSYWGVPNNKTGYQQAYDGNAYVGIVIYYDFYMNQNYREYIQTQLSSPLIAGQIYQVSFYVSLVDNSRLASNNIGAVFTVDQLTGDGSALPISLTPSILNQSIITDTINWVEISGTYVASGGEQYLTIGNFFYNNQSQSQISNSVYGFPSSYYFIDNVSVTQTLGLEDYSINDIKIFPNPTSDIFYISSIENEIITKIELCSQYNVVKQFNKNEIEFNIKELSSGIYYLNVTFESGKTIHSKIIKK